MSLPGYCVEGFPEELRETPKWPPYWAVQREDLAARRFDRVFTTRFWNP